MNNDLKTINFSNKEAQKPNFNGQIPYHDVNTPGAVISPKNNGGAYIAWVNSQTNEVTVTELDSYLNVVREDFIVKSSRFCYPD